MARHSKAKWTKYSVARLIYLASRGATRREIAVCLQRSPIAVKRKMHSVKRAYVNKMPFNEFASRVIQ